MTAGEAFKYLLSGVFIVFIPLILRWRESSHSRVAASFGVSGLAEQLSQIPMGVDYHEERHYVGGCAMGVSRGLHAGFCAMEVVQ